MAKVIDDNNGFDLKALIQFDLLQKIIDQFLKRHNKLEEKYNQLEQKFNDSFNMNFNSNNNNISENVINFTTPPEQKEFNRSFPLLEVQDHITEENVKETLTSPLPECPFTIKDKNELSSNITSLKQVIIVLTDRLDQAESEIKNLQNKIDTESPLHNDNVISQLAAVYDEKFKKTEDSLQEMKLKIQDFNIFDMFKDTGNPNMDAATALIKTMEGKFITKFNFIDEKLKNNDGEILKVKNDVVNIKNYTDSALRSFNSMKDKNEQTIGDNTGLSDKIKQKIKNSNEQVKKELIAIIDKNDLKFQKLISNMDKKLASFLDDPYKQSIGKYDENDIKERLHSAIDEMKILMNQSSHDNELYTKSLIEKLNLDQLRRDFGYVKQALMNKLEKKDLQELYIKQDDLNSAIMSIKEQVDQLKTNNDVLNESNTKILKKVEYFNGIVGTLKMHKNETSKPVDLSGLDLSKYATHTDLNNASKMIINENKKIVGDLEELKNSLYKLSSSLKYFASENDMKNMEQCILNELEEYKLFAAKKFAEKGEMQKSIKYLEMQIKTLTESILSKETGDNWLLAKKPVGMFHCASCDSFIGDLNSKNEFLPWNKIQPREENKYRMGHGFSRMLQMVNMDILKSMEGKVPKDNSNVQNELNIKSLPKIVYSSNYSSNNVEKNVLNISADNINVGGNNNDSNNNNNDYNELNYIESKKNGPKL